MVYVREGIVLYEQHLIPSLSFPFIVNTIAFVGRRYQPSGPLSIEHTHGLPPSYIDDISSCDARQRDVLANHRPVCGSPITYKQGKGARHS